MIKNSDQKNKTLNLLCISCDYDLSGLDPSSKCPECGLLVKRSKKDRILSIISIDNLSMLHRGMSFILKSTLATLILQSIQLLIVFFIRVESYMVTWVECALYFLCIASSIVTALGVWRFTINSTGMTDFPLQKRARRFARTFSVLHVLASVIRIPISIVQSSGIYSRFAKFSISSNAGKISFETEVYIFLMLSVLIVLIAVLPCIKILGKNFMDSSIEIRSSNRLLQVLLWSTIGVFFWGIGPFFAFALSWNFIEETRVYIGKVIESRTVISN